MIPLNSGVAVTPPTANGSPRRRQRTMLAIAIALVVIVGGAAAGFILSDGSGSSRDRSSTTATTGAAPSGGGLTKKAADTTFTVGPRSLDRLKPVKGMTVRKAGTVLTGIDVHGQITIAADDVTVRDFRADNVLQEPGTKGMLLEDGELDGGGRPKNSTDGVAWSDYTARRLNVHNQLDGLKAMGNVLIENCWVHDNNFQSFGNGDVTHNDGVQISSGSNVTIRNSRFERNRGNSAIFVDPDQGRIDHVTVTGNYLGGGGYTFYSIGSKNAPQFGKPTNITVTNNVFSNEHRFHYADVETGVNWSGNVNVDGQPVDP